MATEAVFRTCAQTGLKVHNQAERLIKFHAVAGVFAILTIVSLLACCLPARAASRVDPVRALRQE